MSGFEVVGVVLGAVPLLISGLEHYRDGVETIQDMIQYAEVVSAILISVSTSLAIYRQSCEALLQGLILPPNILDDLLHNSASSVWKDKDLVSQLERRFGSANEFATYVRAVQKLNARVQKMRTKLNLDDNFQPVWMDGSRVDTGKLTEFFSRGRSIIRAVRIGFQNKKYLELALGIERDVSLIKTLTEGARQLEPIRAQRKVREAAKYWLTARECATRLFLLLNSHWSQSCHCCEKPHVASIRLDMVEKQNLAPPGDAKKKFRLLFTFDVEGQGPFDAPWKWRVVEIEPQEAPQASPASSSSPSTPNITTGRVVPATISAATTRAPTPGIIITGPSDTTATLNVPPSAISLHARSSSTYPAAVVRQAGPTTAIPRSLITNLCQALSQASHQQARCLGFLGDEAWQHYFYVTNPWQNMDRWNSGFTSLEQLLKSREPIGTKPKYRIAATLASAVFQFHATPWLNDQWGLREIHFIKDTGSNRTIVDHSYISKRFADCAASHPPFRHHAASVYNETIFALGVALLELSYGEPLLNFACAEDLDGAGGPHGLTELLVAKRLAGGLDEREPSSYVDVVDRCLRCRFDTTSTSLEDPVFLALFWQGVVVPLQQICDCLS